MFLSIKYPGCLSQCLSGGFEEFFVDGIVETRTRAWRQAPCLVNDELCLPPSISCRFILKLAQYIPYISVFDCIFDQEMVRLQLYPRSRPTQVRPPLLNYI